MAKKKEPLIAKRVSPDWCHLCGDISSQNADVQGVARDVYIRVCGKCAAAIDRAANMTV